MLVRHSLTFALLALWASLLTAQNSPRIDTLDTDEGATKMLLNIKVTSGEMFVTSSGLCGKSLSSTVANVDNAKQTHASSLSSDGTLSREINLPYSKDSQAPQSQALGGAPNMRVDPSVANNYRSEYKQDPDLDTELKLELGSGGAWLDLSGMSMKKVKVNSLFSDVLVSYSKPNAVSMEEMTIHVAKAKIILKNLEQAKAKKIQVRNEMGDTKLILGDKGRPGSKIHLKSGFGDCMLVIDKNQPTKIVLAGGVFSEIEVDDSFKPHGKGTYVNSAYLYNPAKCTVVLCEVDLGSISLMAK